MLFILIKLFISLLIFFLKILTSCLLNNSFTPLFWVNYGAFSLFMCYLDFNFELINKMAIIPFLFSFLCSILSFDIINIILNNIFNCWPDYLYEQISDINFTPLVEESPLFSSEDEKSLKKSTDWGIFFARSGMILLCISFIALAPK